MQPEMYAYKCTACGHLHHPAHFVCVQCGSREFEQAVLAGEGTLLTYTRVYNLPEGYMKPFIAFGIVEFPNGLRAAGQMGTDELRLGMKVRAEVGVVKEGVGQDFYGFIFHKAE